MEVSCGLRFLLILVPPTQVTITGHEQVKAGDSIVLSCTTSNSNPQASITWSRMGKEIRTADDATDVSLLLMILLW